jgi:hypothetical protein
MTEVFEFAALDAPWPHGNGGMFARESLNAGHLISAHHTFTRLEQGWRLKVKIGEVGHLLIGGFIGL